MPDRGNKYYKTRNDARRWQLSHDPFDPSTLAHCTQVAKRWLALSDNPSGSPILMTYVCNARGAPMAPRTFGGESPRAASPCWPINARVEVV